MRNTILTLSAVLALFTAASSWSATPPADQNAQARMNAWQMLADSMLRDIDQATWISEGSGAGPLYIFFDPNCPYCHQVFENTREWVKDGKAELRWIPVGILTSTSHGKAAAMLGADDPRKAFYTNENQYKRGQGGGGIDEDLSTPEIDAQLKANLRLLARTRSGAVPMLLFRTKEGAPILIQGAPTKDKMPVILENLGEAAAH